MITLDHVTYGKIIILDDDDMAKNKIFTEEVRLKSPLFGVLGMRERHTASVIAHRYIDNSGNKKVKLMKNRMGLFDLNIDSNDSCNKSALKQFILNYKEETEEPEEEVFDPIISRFEILDLSYG